MSKKDLGDWDRNQCLDWLEEFGYINCVIAGDMLDDELHIEIAIQADHMDIDIPGKEKVLQEYWQYVH